VTAGHQPPGPRPQINAIAVPSEVARAIEGLAMRAWPARLVQPLHGWRLAFGDGLTRRINSVQAIAWDDRAELQEAVRQAERGYAGRGLPTRFRMTAVSRPKELDAFLAGRGYEIEPPSDVLVAEPAQRKRRATRHPVTIAKDAPPGWRELWLAQGGPDEAAGRRGLLGRLPSGTIFALAQTASKPSGIGLAVIEQDWAGIFTMHTAERWRGQGVATAVLDALMAQAAVIGARRLYLQVEQDNVRAQRLYRQAGFTFAYRYHYRTSRTAVGR
jgi:ribosomal protein S18 acetylase RimI-like enzyme